MEHCLECSKGSINVNYRHCHYFALLETWEDKSKILFFKWVHALLFFSCFTESPLVIGFLVGCALGREELELKAGMKGHNA